MRPRRSALPLAAVLATAVIGVWLMTSTMQLLAGRVDLRVTLLAASFALVAPSLALALALRLPAAAVLAGTRPRGPAWLLAPALAAALWIASLGLLQSQAVLWPPDPRYLEAFRQLHAALRPHGALDLLWSLLAIAVAPALCEETLVRGLLLPSFRQHMPPAAAVGLSALAFALMHLDPFRFAFTLAVGLLLGAIRLRAELITCAVVHGVLNALTFGLGVFLDLDDAAPDDSSLAAGLGLLTLGTALCALTYRALASSLTDRTPRA